MIPFEANSKWGCCIFSKCGSPILQAFINNLFIHAFALKGSLDALAILLYSGCNPENRSIFPFFRLE